MITCGPIRQYLLPSDHFSETGMDLSSSDVCFSNIFDLIFEFGYEYFLSLPCQYCCNGAIVWLWMVSSYFYYCDLLLFD